ncbi:hypothetical protein ACIG8K_05310 [Streptomyces halstedii]|uniref:hypothetical protein n=1 Tax=Streptomyces halstedii TaxID=1944 RepID=UPI0037D6BFAB
MTIDFVALHEPLVEWVHEQTAADSADYVTITAFGEQHGLDEQQSFRLLLTCKDWGLLSERFQSGHRWGDGGEAATHEAPAPLREVFEVSTHQRRCLVGSLSCRT